MSTEPLQAPRGVQEEKKSYYARYARAAMQPLLDLTDRPIHSNRPARLAAQKLIDQQRRGRGNRRKVSRAEKEEKKRVAKARHNRLSVINSGTEAVPNSIQAVSGSGHVEPKSAQQGNSVSDAEATALAEMIDEQLRWRQEDMFWWKEQVLESFWRGYRQPDRTSSALSPLAQEQYDRRLSKRNSRTSVAFYRLPLELPSAFPSEYVSNWPLSLR